MKHVTLQVASVCKGAMREFVLVYLVRCHGDSWPPSLINNPCNITLA